MPDGRIQPKKGAGVLRVVDGQGSLPESLVREAATSADALELLCDHYIPKIYNFILKRVGSVPDAEDITSIVFEKVVVNLGSFDETRASFTTWIYKIAANSVTDFYRSKGRRKESSLDDDAAGAVADEGDELERADLYMVLIDLMKKLPPKYAEALSMRYFAGMRVQEVAATLGITESAASKRILRGLEGLRQLAEGGPLDRLI
jgi:RNA polymerase sigma-70 factor (ECF subfamily)